MWRRSPAQNEEMPVRIKQRRDGGGVPVDPETRSKTWRTEEGTGRDGLWGEDRQLTSDVAEKS